MKKIIIYTLLTSLITSFSINKNAYAEKITNYNNEIVKLELNNKNLFPEYFLKNDIQILNANNSNETLTENDFNPTFINLIIPGFTQFYYGDTTKGILFFATSALVLLFITPLSKIVSIFLMGGNGSNWEFMNGVFILVPIAIISYIWGLTDANYMYIKHMINNANKNKVSLNKNNVFNIALFSKDF
ncbi:MAG: hypothetical protein U0457_08075 [Candidatus Sericytochromatia bacterium]